MQLIIQALCCLLLVMSSAGFAATTKAPVTSNLPTIDYKQQDDNFWRRTLSADLYKICREHGSEPADSGVYNKFIGDGIYYCACCGGEHPIYSSAAKYDAGTGWPSFWQPYDANSVEYVQDRRLLKQLLGTGTEVICKRCGSHLGHRYDDGPVDKTGKRHSINSLALKFVETKKAP